MLSAAHLFLNAFFVFFLVHWLVPDFMALCSDFAATIQRFTIFGITSNMLVKRHYDFLALALFTGVYVIVTLILLSVTLFGVDTIESSRIYLRFCWSSHLLECWYIFFMLFIHLSSKENLVPIDRSVPMVSYDIQNVMIVTYI